MLHFRMLFDYIYIQNPIGLQALNKDVFFYKRNSNILALVFTPHIVNDSKDIVNPKKLKIDYPKEPLSLLSNHGLPELIVEYITAMGIMIQKKK